MTRRGRRPAPPPARLGRTLGPAALLLSVAACSDGTIATLERSDARPRGHGSAMATVRRAAEPPADRASTPTTNAAAAPTAPPTPAPAARGGYWLSVDLVGPAAAQREAASRLGEGLTPRQPVEGRPTGVLLGHVAEVGEAITWVADHAFEPRGHLPSDERSLNRSPAPVPGGAAAEVGAIATAFVVSGATTQLRPRTIAWPVDQATIVPPQLEWLPAATVPRRAPLFAAPAATIPPAAERYAMAHRRGGLYVLGWFDRCEPTPTGPRCLRWAQVIARDHDRFTPGYLPMAQVALRDAWQHGATPLPRAQLLPSGMADGHAQWVLLARGVDNQLHRITITEPAPDERWPKATLRVEDGYALVTLGPTSRPPIALDASLDLYRKPPPSEP